MKLFLVKKNPDDYCDYNYTVYDTVAETHIGDVHYDGDNIYYEPIKCSFTKEDLIEIADLLSKKKSELDG